MTQPTLFTDDQPPESVRGPRRARKSDPVSSHIAAAEAEASGLVNAHCAKIIQAMIGQAWMTYEEIAHRCGLEKHAVARRLPELRRNGQVVCGPMRKLPGRSKCQTWRLVEG